MSVLGDDTPMTHRVRLVFEDDRTIALQARSDETVVAAALRERVHLETDCLEGACATCKALCTAGSFALDDYSKEALDDTEREAGYTLLCQTRVSADCTLELPYAAARALARRPTLTHAGRLAAIEPIAEGVVRLEIECADAIDFLPGQYMHLCIPGADTRRSYSMANPPGRARLEFYIKLLEAGVMSDYARERARVGDAIELGGPLGHFYLRPPLRPMLMVAGGTGLAPLLAMLEWLAVAGGAAQPIRLLYGANRPEELFALDALARLARALPLTFESVTHDHVTTRLRPELLSGGACDAYLCGPPPMVDTTRAWLARHGIAAACIHNEKFVAS